MGFQFTKHPKYYIFLETLGKIQFNGDDPDHYEHHQEGHNDQKYPPSTGRLLKTIFLQIPYVTYIFGNLRQNAVQWR